MKKAKLALKNISEHSERKPEKLTGSIEGTYLLIDKTQIIYCQCPPDRLAAMGVVRHQSKHQSIQDKCCTSASNPEEGRGEGGRVPNTGSSMFEFGWGTKFQRVGEHEHNRRSFRRAASFCEIKPTKQNGCSWHKIICARTQLV